MRFRENMFPCSVTELTSLSQIDGILSAAISGLSEEKAVASLMLFDPLMKTCTYYSVLFSQAMFEESRTSAPLEQHVCIYPKVPALKEISKRIGIILKAIFRKKEQSYTPVHF